MTGTCSILRCPSYGIHRFSKVKNGLKMMVSNLNHLLGRLILRGQTWSRVGGTPPRCCGRANTGPGVVTHDNVTLGTSIRGQTKQTMETLILGSRNTHFGEGSGAIRQISSGQSRFSCRTACRPGPHRVRQTRSPVQAPQPTAACGDWRRRRQATQHGS